MSKLPLRTTLSAVCVLMLPLVGCADHDAVDADDTSADAAPVDPPPDPPTTSSVALATGLTHGGTFVIKPRGNDNSFIPIRVTDGAWGNGITQVSGDTDMNAQFRAYRNGDDGTWTFKDVPTQRCLDVSGYGTANSTPVHVWDCHGGTNQRFFVTPVANTAAEYVLAPKHAPSMRLDVGGVGYYRLQIYQSNGTSAQRMTFHTSPSTCDWTVKKGNGRVTRPTGVACRTLLDERPDATSADVGTAEAVGGWKHWPAFFASQAVGVVAAGVVAGVMLQTPVASWADVAAGCVWAGLSTGLYDRLVDGRFNVYQVSDGIINCLAGAVGTALVTRVSEVVSTAAGALRTEVNAAMARFWRGSQAADVEFGPGLEMVLIQVGSGATRQGPPGLGYFAGLPGGAKDIAAYGRHVWIIGTTPEGGGYGIYKWNGSSWTKVPGGAVRVAVGPDGEAWVVNSAGQIFQRTEGTWKLHPGGATDIGIGSDGSVWIIGTTPEYGGYGIYKWNGSSWTKVPGGAVRIAADGAGQPWIVNSFGQIFRGTAGGAWTLLPGGARDIGAYGNSVWVIGTDAEYGGNGIHWYRGDGFAKVPGGAVAITVGADGHPWIVNSFGQIFLWK